MSLNLNKKQMESFLKPLGKEMIRWISLRDIEEVMFDTTKNWKMIFESIEKSEGQFQVFVDLYHSFAGNDQELEEIIDEIIRPHIASRVEEILGAKKVTIEW